MINRFGAFTLLTLICSLLAPSLSYGLISVAERNAELNARKKPHPFRVVLDPGHGGIDHGTSYKDVLEKDATLMLAREVAAQLKTRGIEVVLTRDADHEMPLAARTAMANKLGADAFISIHMNSLPGNGEESVSGTETYILNNATDGSSKRLAQLENMVMAGEPPSDGSEPNDVALILKDLRLDANLPESKRLACMIQSQMVIARSKVEANAVRTDRGVRQALFFVLLGADMPSALVEAGFLSSEKDRAWILSKTGQKSVGIAIARAINLFRMQKNSPQAQKTLDMCKVH